MSDKHNKRLKRRNVLTATGAGIAGLSGLSTSTLAAPADTSSNRDCKECRKPELLAEDSRYSVYRVARDADDVIVYVDRTFKSASYRLIDDDVGALNERQLGIENGQIRPTNHEGIISDFEYWGYGIGNCNGYVYSDHYAVGISVTTGEAMNDIPGGVLEAALCALMAARASKNQYVIAGAAVVCWGVGYLFLDHIELSGYSVSLGIWDCHGGYFNHEGICTGVAPWWTENHSSLLPTDFISGPHLELGESITNYL